MGQLKLMVIDPITRNDREAQWLLCLFHELDPILDQLPRISSSEFRGHPNVLAFRPSLASSSLFPVRNIIASYRERGFENHG